MATASISIKSDMDLYKIMEDLIKIYSEKEKGEIIIMSANKKEISLCVSYKSLQGIIIEKDNDYIRIIVRPLSSIHDYQLFANAILCASRLTNSETRIDDLTVLPTSDDVLSFKWDKWIDFITDEDFKTLSEYIDTYGEVRTYNGVSFPFCIGPRLLWKLNRDKNRLTETLTESQWRYRNTPKAKQGILGNEGTHDKITLTVFATNTEIDTEGLIIPLSESLAIADDKNIRGITRFRHTIQIFNGFKPIDEEQIYISGPLSKSQKEGIISLSQLYAERNVFKDYPMPGFGKDDEQRTFILLWDPEVSSIKLNDYFYWMERMRSEESNWSVTEIDKIRPGDQWFIVLCGNSDKPGIVASGLIDSNPWQGYDRSIKEREGYYCDIVPNVLANPVKAQFPSIAELKYHMPDFEWGIGESGRLLPPQYAIILEELWHKQIERWQHHGVDNTTVRIMPSI